MTAIHVLQFFVWPLLGVAVGALFAFRFNRRLARVKAAVDLHTEFDSESFHQARIEANEALNRLIGRRKVSVASLEDGCTEEQWRNVSRVLHFFERLSRLREHRLIDPQTTDLLFDPYITHWHRHFSRLKEEPGEWLPMVQALHRLPQQSTQEATQDK